MNTDSLNDYETFALNMLKVSLVIVVFLSVIFISPFVYASTISPSPGGRGEISCYCTPQEVTDCQPSGISHFCTTSNVWHTCCTI